MRIHEETSVVVLNLWEITFIFPQIQGNPGLFDSSQRHRSTERRSSSFTPVPSLLQVRPHGPVGGAIVFAEIFIHDAAEVVFVHGCFQGHVVEVACAELTEVSAEVFDAFVRGFGPWFGGIVMADVNDGSLLQRAAVHGHYLIFQDGGVIVEFALEDGTFRDFQEAGGDFDGALGGEMGIGCGRSGRFLFAGG